MDAVGVGNMPNLLHTRYRAHILRVKPGRWIHASPEQRAVRFVPISRSTLLLLLAVAGGTACVRVNHPITITQPTRVVPQLGRQRDVPREAVHWYPSFWRAVAEGNLKVAWVMSDGRDERRIVDALETMLRGELDSAELQVRPLVSSSDSMVRRAARVTYGALLSANGHWGRLAAFVDTLSDSTERVLRDDAGVERWAAQFRGVGTQRQFVDSAVVLPLTRSVTGTPIVPVVVNGVTRHFWLDTGSSITILSSRSAAECNVAPLTRDTLQLMTSVGRLPAQPAVVNSLRVGGFEITRAPAMILDGTALTIESEGPAPGTAAAEHQVEGVIGYDVIRQLDVTVDDVRETVTIRRPVPAAHDSPRNLSWFGVPIVTVLSERGSVLHLVLDTGADGTFGTVSLVTKTGAHWAPAERRRVRGFGGSVMERGMVVPSLRLFLGKVQLLLRRVFLYNAQYPTIFVIDGTLGSDLGRGGVLRIDATNGRVEVQ